MCGCGHRVDLPKQVVGTYAMEHLPKCCLIVFATDVMYHIVSLRSAVDCAKAFLTHEKKQCS